MKHVSLLSFGIIALVGTQTATAADLSYRAPIVAPAVATVHNWTGCYVGAYIGGASGAHAKAAEGTAQPGGVFAPGTSYDFPNTASYSYPLNAGVIGGGTVGCNYQVNTFVLGLEGEFGYLNSTGSVVNPNSVAFGSDVMDTTKVGDWYGVIAARAGFTVDRALLYLKGGAAFVRTNSTVTDTCNNGVCGTGTINASGNGNTASWVVGGGIEYALSQNWSVKGEYLYMDLHNNYSTCGPGGGTAAGSTFCWTHELDGIHTVKVGLNYKFDWERPLLARY